MNWFEEAGSGQMCQTACIVVVGLVRRQQLQCRLSMQMTGSVVARNGTVIHKGKVPSTPADIAAKLAQLPACRRIVFETGRVAPMLYHGLLQLGTGFLFQLRTRSYRVPGRAADHYPDVEKLEIGPDEKLAKLKSEGTSPLDLARCLNDKLAGPPANFLNAASVGLPRIEHHQKDEDAFSRTMLGNRSRLGKPTFALDSRQQAGRPRWFISAADV